MTDPNEAAARLRRCLMEFRFGAVVSVHEDDLRAILDERDGLILQLAGVQRSRDAFQRRAQMLEAEMERREEAEKQWRPR